LESDNQSDNENKIPTTPPTELGAGGSSQDAPPGDSAAGATPASESGNPSDDQGKLPTTPLTEPGAVGSPQDAPPSDSAVGATPASESDNPSDDQGKLPTNPLTELGAGGSPQDAPLSDSGVGGALAAGGSRGASGPWEPPSPEELQLDFQQYEIRGILGRGGMGAVYKGWQKNLDRFVAIKILPPGLDDGVADYTERFKREAKAMAHLRHPGIVAVHEAGTTASGLLYFVMECVEGTDVQRLMSGRKQLDPGEALRITSAVCDALAYAHSKGVIHRDIKPSNIMLDEHDTVKVADFGLAKSTAPETTALTVSRVMMGTLDFMAPEAHQGVAHVDRRVDIYAVGVMLYQMLTGKLPRGKYDRPSRVVPGLDKRLDRIVDRALQPDPAARYSSATELRADLEPVARSLARRAAARSRKTPARIAVAVLALGVVAVLARFGPWKTGAANGKPRTLVSPAPPGIAHGPSAVKATTPDTATIDAPFVNTLGQEFVPVDGTGVLFCRWETRVKDYEAFANTTELDDSWKKQEKDGLPVSSGPEYPVIGVAMAIVTIVRSVGTGPDNPVVGVNWNDAKAFCDWLTVEEHAEGKLPKGMEYRLPTDVEWSRAVGLPDEGGATPKERHGKNTSHYPWGAGYPPPKPGVGNYADSAYHQLFPKKEFIKGYTDGFAMTAPVGSFPPNQFGIYDLGGNVWEWCEDLFDPEGTDRAGRGASWVNPTPSPLSSSRMNAPSENRKRDLGFRVVLQWSAPPANAGGPPKVPEGKAPADAGKN
jgi:formylglycine-generating enzyme required for sulfatase activity/tRNA A-37 threonylcarbamoyl transferase component Bud32